MSRFPAYRRVLFLLAALPLLIGGLNAQTCRLSSRFLARGEKALLEIAVSSPGRVQITSMPEVPGVTIEQQSFGPVMRQTLGRMNEQVWEFVVSSYNIGSHTIPPVELSLGGNKMATEPLDFVVFNPDDLKWEEASAGNLTFKYATAFRATNLSPYNGESTPVELKVYVPTHLMVVDWGIPDFQRDGVTAWRFQPNPTRSLINLLGVPYMAVAYPSTLNPLKDGPVGIGPAKVRLTIRTVDLDGGYPQQVSQQAFLNVPKLGLESRPLPPGAPEGFENAIGSFRMTASSEVTEIQEGDPVPLEIEVRGSGNLDTLRPPVPADPKGWKVYETTAEQRGDERRELSGSTRFHLFMRPLELKTQIPQFKLVYFDPVLKEYKTALTNPLPLTMKAAPKVAMEQAVVPQALTVPVERMTDILGVLRPSTLLLPDGPAVRPWMWHSLAGLIALALLGKAWWMRNQHRFKTDPMKQQRSKDLREVERFQGDDNAFLMTVGRFIERWLSSEPKPELSAVLAERDTRCFRNDGSGKPELSSKRRREILDLLRKSALVLVAALCLNGGTTRADEVAIRAQEAYNAAKYDEAAATWLKAGPYERLSADTLYNIGNASYRLGSPGNAALYYRRALTREPGHAEARQNLRFIERKYGSITVKRPDYQYALAKLPLDAWKGMLWAGLWACVLAILVFPATREGAWLRIPALIALICGPILAGCGALGWRYYPNDAEFASLAKQAVITQEGAVIHADASRTSPDVIDAPPGSLCEVIRESGRWAYVSFATKTRGWIPLEMIEKVVPDKTPEPPSIRKARADGKSA